MRVNRLPARPPDAIHAPPHEEAGNRPPSLHQETPSERAPSISSVVFEGGPANPTVRIAGRGFNPRPSATGIAYEGSTAQDYGTALHIADSTGLILFAFDAGYDDLPAGRHDYIGLVILNYNDSDISYTLGSNHTTDYYPNHTFQLNEGDNFTAYVRGAFLWWNRALSL